MKTIDIPFPAVSYQVGYYTTPFVKNSVVVCMLRSHGLLSLSADVEGAMWACPVGAKIPL